MSEAEKPVVETDAQPCPDGRWLSIIGIGEDGVAGLSPVARDLLARATLVVGGSRHLQLAHSLIAGETLVWPNPITAAYPEIVARRGQSVVVLASGDPFNFGVGKALTSFVSPDEMFSLPQPSSFSLAASRLGWALQDVETLSVHGRALEGVIRHLHPGARLMLLAWDETTAAKLATLLCERGLGRSRVHVLEALGGPDERVRVATSDQFDVDAIHPLNVVAVEVAADAQACVINYSAGLDDTLFENDGQLTRREIRAVTISSLAPRRDEMLWDIGLGSGSVAIEWLLSHPSLKAIGVEAQNVRADRAARNAGTLGVPQLQIVRGEAPGALSHLPAPDAVFIGGGITCPGVFEAAWHHLRPGGRLVANAVTLESEARVLELAKTHGGDLVRLAVSRAEPVGRFMGWRPAMPVTQWRVVKS
ncbi:MAG: precorrin-6y C5,15-methyltransferase (decarboxylating) subunit CbiE [Pseudomonadota bacterium]